MEFLWESGTVSEFWNLFESVPWAKFSMTSEMEGMIPYQRSKAVLKNDGTLSLVKFLTVP